MKQRKYIVGSTQIISIMKYLYNINEIVILEDKKKSI